jgi:hypothetical protein
MIPFQRGDPEVHRYLLDYRNPAVRAYVEGVIKDFFNTHGADGILLDGLADAEGQLIPRAERDDPNGPPHPLLPTLDIYRLTRTAADRERPHAFVESGWLNPTAANPYAQIFRYGDEIDRVDSPYPFGGFLQKLDYAIFSRMALGQRSYVGTATGDPTRSETRWWLEAAAALGSHATLSLDLSRMNAETLAALRADLVALDPFNGTTAYGPGLFPETFATTRNGTTYLGVVNREPRARAMQVGLEPLGLNGMGPLTAFEPESGRSRRIDADFSVELGPKSFRLLVLRRDPGLVWSDSVVSPAATTSRGLSLDVRGPAQVPGATRLATPPPTGVWLDGMPLAAAPTGSSAGYVYDDTSGLLTVAYTHTDQRRIDVSW